MLTKISSEYWFYKIPLIIRICLIVISPPIFGLLEICPKILFKSKFDKIIKIVVIFIILILINILKNYIQINIAGKDWRTELF